MKLRTLIADDEPLARERLRYLLSSDEEIEIVGECTNGREVIAALRNSGVDLLFSRYSDARPRRLRGDRTGRCR